MAITLPTNLGYGTVNGKYFLTLLDNADPDREPEIATLPAESTVTFTPGVKSYKNLAVPATYLTVTTVGKFNEDGELVDHNGNLGVVLLASDNDDLSPNGWAYTVQVSIPGQTFPAFEILVKAGETLDLTTVSPATTGGGVTVLVSEEARLAAEAAASEAQSWAQIAMEAAEARISADSGNALVQGSDGGMYVSVPEPDTTQYATPAQVSAASTDDRNRTNHTGTQAATTVDETATRKWLTDTERTKLAGVATGATANDTNANLRNRANHTGSQTAATISDLTEAVQDILGLAFTGGNVTASYNDTAGTISLTAPEGSVFDPEATRDAIGAALVGVGLISITINDAADTITIATTATQNSTDAQLRARSSHTGTQAISTVTGLQAELDSKLESYTETYATAAPGSMFYIRKSGGTWPSVRPSSRDDILFAWIGAEPSPPEVTSGDAGMRRGLDLRFITTD